MHAMGAKMVTGSWAALDKESPSNEGGGPSLLFSTGDEVTPGVLCLVLGSSIQGRHGCAGESLIKGHQDD